MLFHTLHFLMYVNISFWSTASPLCATVSLTMLSYFSLFFLPALSVCLTLKHLLRCLSSCWRRGCTCHLLSSFHCVCQVATAGQVCNGGDAWQSGLMGHFCKCCSLHLCSQLGSGTVSLPTTKVFASHKYVQGRQCACQGRYAAGDALREQTMIDQRCGSPGEGAQICGESGRKWPEFLILLLLIELDNTTTCSGYPKCAVKPGWWWICERQASQSTQTTPSIDDNLITRPSRKICRDATKWVSDVCTGGATWKDQIIGFGGEIFYNWARQTRGKKQIQIGIAAWQCKIQTLSVTSIVIF